VIKKQSSLDISIYEKNGQKSFFGRDNLFFKTVNMPKKQNFDNICKKFKLKKLVQNTYLPLKIIIIYNI